jgi:hypothetical protein
LNGTIVTGMVVLLHCCRAARLNTHWFVSLDDARSKMED